MDGQTDKWTFREIEGLEHIIIFFLFINFRKKLALSKMNLILPICNKLN